VSLDASLVQRTLLPGEVEEIPASADRFGRRWRLVAAGLSNVWRFGDLLMDSNSGRLLMRGPNGSGKTTALEALWPYLLDLNSRLLGAGKARQTTWTSLMREGANGVRRRVGYVWLTFAGPGESGELSYGVRLQFSEGSSPPVKMVPFKVPGRPVTDVPLVGDGRGALSLDEFTDVISTTGGQVFADEEEYVADLAARMLRTSAAEARLLAGRIRQVRNPNLLGNLSPQEARDALRDALPGVADDVIVATADALAESAETRKAFDRDRDNAKVVADFAAVWAGHAAEILHAAHKEANDARGELRRRQVEAKRIEGQVGRVQAAHDEAKQRVESLTGSKTQLEGRIKGLEATDAFRSAGALTALEQQLRAEQDTAKTRWSSLAAAARETRNASAAVGSSLTELADDIRAYQKLVSEADPDVAGLEPLVTWRRAPRAVLTVGDLSVDAGPLVTMISDEKLIADAVVAWRAAADSHATRAEVASLALADHEPVAAADGMAHTAEQLVAGLNERLDADEGRLRQLIENTAAAAATLIDQVVEWTFANRHLANTPTDAPDDGAELAAYGDGWDTPDVEALRDAEPGQVLDATDSFAGTALTWANARACRLRADAGAADRRAADLLREARELRDEAAKLRAGKLLALPRPDWAGDGVDDDALGSALDWQPSLGGDARPALEAALAAAGLLGATLTVSGASTMAWQVGAQGQVMPQNLTTALTVDPEHPLAAIAAAVLERVALVNSAASDIESAALVVGRDGTFRAGVVVGAPVLAPGMATFPPAQHVGARQRRAAALARADQYDAEATELESQAEDAATHAAGLRQEAAQLLHAASLFPRREPLRMAEAGRAAKAVEVTGLLEELDNATKEARQRRREHQQLHEEWVERTRSHGLPVLLAELAAVETAKRVAAHTLRTSAGELADRFAPRLGRLRAAATSDDGTTGLTELLGQARTAATRATQTQSRMDALRESAGAGMDEVLERHREAEDKLAEVIEHLESATEERERLSQETARLIEQLRSAHKEEEEALPLLDHRMRELTRLLDVPGVIEALFAATRPRADQLLIDVAAGLASVGSYTKKTLRDRYDEARARLAGSWALGSGDPLGELDTYVFSYGEDSFTPARAAAHATALADSAEAALAAAEEKALHDFVVGLLPTAIRTGWIRMHDWTKEVNRKMRSAAASSQLSVQVRVNLASDMSEHARTVYELACKVFEGDRTAEQDTAVGQALQALINAADGETMVDKVAAAVNIRGWVDVTYEIHRPNGTTVNWTSRTGLSGGERRLVVLAPMLAAIAAGYDRSGETVLRLAALDEVPAEVDEQGREGLARYLARLDLDLICTSYLWDGAPGAWDGIDAWDLESAHDTTVVGFPMLVRGLVPLPGDDVTLNDPGIT
jgi:Putative exonuclease SbcCD, C subunit